MDPRELLLGKELVEQELLTADQLHTALEYQSQLPARLEDILVKLDFVDEGRLSAFVAEREHLPTVDLTARTLDRELLAQIPRTVIETHEVLPFRLNDETVLLVMSDPTDFRAIDEVQFLTSAKIETAVAPRSIVREQIERYYSSLPAPPPAPPSLVERLLGQVADPTVRALARALLRNGVITPEEWQEGFNETPEEE